MNDYRFGNFICERRRKAGLSQSDLAEKLGVTNKAVSKWENGKSKPTADTLRRLAVLFEIPLEMLMVSELTINSTTKSEGNKKDFSLNCSENKYLI